MFTALRLFFGHQLQRLRWPLIALALAAALAEVLYTWHVLDKRQAVAAAKGACVGIAEGSAVQAELDALKNRARVAEEGNMALEDKAATLEGEVARLRNEVEVRDYGPDESGACRIDPDLFDRLRGK